MAHHHAHHGSPTEMLMAEHEVILKVLDAFERLLGRVEAGRTPDPEAFGKAVEFFRGFADRCHHAKEEDHLFPAMEAAGVPREGGPVGVMLEEHDQGREYVGQIVQGLEELSSSPEAAGKRIYDNGWAYAQMLRAHIRKENEILFPLAERSIPEETMHHLGHAFEETEAAMGEGTHERFLALADEIEAASR